MISAYACIDVNVLKQVPDKKAANFKQNAKDNVGAAV